MDLFVLADVGRVEQVLVDRTGSQTFIETALTATMFEDENFVEWVTSRIALGRIGRIEEVMGAVTFLAGNASILMTGSALVLDGGWTAA